MIICEWCGKEFDLEEAADEFDCEMPNLIYENVKKCLCGKCAIDAIRDEVDGVYFETCEECGMQFDYIEAESEFSSNFSWENGTTLTDYWNSGVLCCNCALKIAQNE